MHFMNPVPVMKLVEVIRGYATSDATCREVMELSAQLGKVPVEVNDYPGFVANRILMPMINEAILTLHEGVAGVEEIDTVMKLGMAHPMGPLQLADFIGLDVCLSILRVLHDGLGQDKYAPCPLLVNMVTAGKLGVKSGEGFYVHTRGSKASRGRTNVREVTCRMAKDAVHPSRRETSFGWMEVTVARGDEPIVERLGFERNGRAHQHDMWEHCRVVSGSGTIVVGDERVSVKKATHAKSRSTPTIGWNPMNGWKSS